MDLSLVPPCTYQGGKQRYSKQIIDIITRNSNEDSIFYDICCGSGAITLQLVNCGISPENIVMIDNSMWGCFWRSVGEGDFNLIRFKEILLSVPDDKNLIKSYVENIATKVPDDDKVYYYLILQSCSFGGKQVDVIDSKWKHHGFRGYWQPTETSIRKSPVNPMQPNKDELLRRVSEIHDKCLGVKCINEDINTIDFKFKKEDIIYIDPPYMNSTGYNYNLNILEFCNRYDNIFYVSEKQKISDNAICLNLKGAKGGVTAKKKGRDEEWLNVINI